MIKEIKINTWYKCLDPELFIEECILEEDYKEYFIDNKVFITELDKEDNFLDYRIIKYAWSGDNCVIELNEMETNLFEETTPPEGYNDKGEKI